MSMKSVYQVRKEKFFNTSKDTSVLNKRSETFLLPSLCFFPIVSLLRKHSIACLHLQLFNGMRACKSNLFSINDRFSIDSDGISVGWCSSVLLHS
ncbi:hypothetical protein CEXT_390711 [Caerostris extrusa]|uniref:Uncharacterized protein n=1 Tax=Caerostris extrusa TaxID=172846 RepID=A0AAV4NL19_CAEEX|nr:hypothetical protein CEXT_390711 [Caerostris extrusa]